MVLTDSGLIAGQDVQDATGEGALFSLLPSPLPLAPSLSPPSSLSLSLCVTLCASLCSEDSEQRTIPAASADLQERETAESAVPGDSGTDAIVAAPRVPSRWQVSSCAPICSRAVLAG